MKVRSIVATSACAVALAASPAIAGGGNGLISNLTVAAAGNVVWFALMPTQTPLPACATTGRFAFSVSTPSGQAALALVMTAYSQGKKITAVGTGVCDVWGDSETLSYIVSP